MKKIVLALVLVSSMFFSMNTIAKRCVEIDATRHTAGRILDWCDDVTCRKCVDADGPGATIYTTECWANC